MALGEFEIIDRFFRRPPHHDHGVRLGIGDDAALLELPPGSDLVAALDTIVAGRHFPEDADARSVGHRALAVNLSDLAAMGATPAWALMGLTLREPEERWLGEFADGWFDLAGRHGVELVGGDTTSGPLTVSVQLSGWVERGTALRRSGGRPGDLLVVTGTLGDAAAGLAIASGNLRADAPADEKGARAATSFRSELRRRFEYPEPRVEFGRLARGLATAAMDLSDGIAGDLPKLAMASGVAARVAVDRLPLSPALRSLVPQEKARHWALSGGDDYELLLSVPSGRLADLLAAAGQCQLKLSQIGELCAGSGVTWSMDGRPLEGHPAGYEHFR